MYPPQGLQRKFWTMAFSPELSGKWLNGKTFSEGEVEDFVDFLAPLNFWTKSKTLRDAADVSIQENRHQVCLVFRDVKLKDERRGLRPFLEFLLEAEFWPKLQKLSKFFI
jgi:hypothetical protein